MQVIKCAKKKISTHDFYSLEQYRFLMNIFNELKVLTYVVIVKSKHFQTFWNYCLFTLLKPKFQIIIHYQLYLCWEIYFILKISVSFKIITEIKINNYCLKVSIIITKLTLSTVLIRTRVIVYCYKCIQM